MRRQELVIIRGLPGSGKSTFAKRLSERFGYVHLEADQFRHDEDGNYVYSKGDSAITECMLAVEEELSKGRNVIVANIFPRWYQVESASLSAKFINEDLRIRVFTMRGNYLSIHGVPEEEMDRLREFFEYR